MVEYNYIEGGMNCVDGNKVTIERKEERERKKEERKNRTTKLHQENESGNKSLEGGKFL